MGEALLRDCFRKHGVSSREAESRSWFPQRLKPFLIDKARLRGL